MRAIIVDDEGPARRELRRLLAEFPEVEILGEAGDLDSAARLIERTAPDVVFLDIRLGRASGFDLVDRIDAGISIIFVTAYGDYAVQAFEAQAVDYLLKPIEPERLRQCVARLAAPPSPALEEPAARRWLFLDDRDRPELLAIERIALVEAEGRRSRIRSVDGVSRSSAKPLAEWESRLPREDFVRVHRSALVNLRHVEHIEPWFHYGLRMRVRGVPEPVPVSRRRTAELRSRLG